MLARLRRPVRTSLRSALRLVTGPLRARPDLGRPPTDHPTVGVVGFYGFGNYGDELFWEVFREYLGSAMELQNLLGPGEKGNHESLRRAVRDVDAVIVGGGDLVIPWRPSRYWNKALLERPVFVAGVGVPNWQGASDRGLAQLRRFFGDPAVRLVAARDTHSADWIAESLQPGTPVVLVPDLVCGLTLPPVSPPPGPPILGVNVRRRGEGVDDLSRVRELCERAMARGFRIRRIVLGTGGVREADLEATRGLGLDDTELVASNDLDTISRAIGECRAFATMKFHGVVVATMYGVTPIALMPTAKTKSFLGDLGRPELVFSYVDPSLPAVLERVPKPVSAEARERLRGEARAFLGGLRSAILTQAAAGLPAHGARSTDLSEGPAG